MSPDSIADDEVETITCPTFLVIFKTNKGVKHSNRKLRLNHDFSWKCNDFGDAWVTANNFWSPESWIGFDKLYPLRYSFVEEFVNSLQLYDLLVGSTKSCMNDNRADG